MANNTQFLYDWNEENGFIWPGNIFQSTKDPFIRSDINDAENVDEADYNIIFNDAYTRVQTYVKMDVYSDPDINEAYIQYASNKYIMHVRVGTITSTADYDIKPDGYLSENDDKKLMFFLFDDNDKMITGMSATGKELKEKNCYLKNLKYTAKDGFYFEYANEKYFLYSQTVKCVLKDFDIPIGGLAVWDADYALKLMIPVYGNNSWNGIPVYYRKRDLANNAQYGPEIIKKHCNDIVAMYVYAPLADILNLYDTKSQTVVNYYGVKKISDNFWIFSKNISRIHPRTDSRNVDEILDDVLSDETIPWMTPSEFYNDNNTTTKNIKTGDDGYVVANAGDDGDTKTTPVWFWVNSLANWCTFKHNMRHCTTLCVWNGMNGWDPLDDIIKPNTDAKIILNRYYYDYTRFIKGVNVSSQIYRNLSMRYRYIKLPYDSKFSQYDENTFQCIKIGRVHLNNKSMLRYPFTTGIPPIMRLPSGELALIYYLVLPGMTTKHEVIWPDNMDFINSVCQAYFGSGNDKTIKEDWKRFYKLKDVLEERANDIVTDDVSTLVDADEINTIHEDIAPLNVTLNIPRQYPETLDATPDSYVEDWRR